MLKNQLTHGGSMAMRVRFDTEEGGGSKKNNAENCEKGKWGNQGSLQPQHCLKRLEMRI